MTSSSANVDAHEPQLVIFISSGINNTSRRAACRGSWFRYRHDADSPLPEAARQRVELIFAVAASGKEQLQQEMDTHGDLLLLDAAEGYEHLWRRALTFLSWLQQNRQYDYVMHADDDSFVRLDLLMPYLDSCPRQRFYWGYVWDGTGNRTTAPIRNPANKSHMPVEQYPLDYYPPFASGCGFILTPDLVAALIKQPLPDYRLLDPPFGIHLCGHDACVLDEPVVPVHEERVRPYRPLPTFRPDTLVQHYLRSEEMKPFYEQALECSKSEAQGTKIVHTATAASELYDSLVHMGLLRR